MGQIVIGERWLCRIGEGGAVVRRGAVVRSARRRELRVFLVGDLRGSGVSSAEESLSLSGRGEPKRALPDVPKF